MDFFSLSKKNQAKVIRKAANFLTDNNWTKKVFQSDNKFCAIGAIEHVCGGAYIGFTSGRLNQVMNLNDANSTTLPQVKKALREVARELEHGGCV